MDVAASADADDDADESDTLYIAVEGDDVDGDAGDAKQSCACVMSWRMERQQSSRIEVKRDDDNLRGGLAVGEDDSERKNEERCSQN